MALGTIFTVDTTGDGGTMGGTCPSGCDDQSGNPLHCSLRAAIECDILGRPGVCDTVSFNIPAATDPGCNAISGVCTLTPATQHLNIVCSAFTFMTIDGTSEPGSSCGDLWGGTPPVWNIAIDSPSN